MSLKKKQAKEMSPNQSKETRQLNIISGPSLNPIFWRNDPKYMKCLRRNI